VTYGKNPDCAIRLAMQWVTSFAYPRRRCSSKVNSKPIPNGGLLTIQHTSWSLLFKNKPTDGIFFISSLTSETQLDMLCDQLSNISWA
jgi:hypothetical protein